MVTIKQVAEMAGVSRRTVDRVLNKTGAVKPETAERIRQIAEEMNYHPNAAGRTLAAGRKNIRLAFCSVKGSQSVIHEEIRKGAWKKTQELERLGIQVKHYIIDRENPLPEEEREQMVESFDCDGLAVVPSEVPEIVQLIRKAEEMKIPIVFYNVDKTYFKRTCYVGCDYFKSGRLAAGMMGLCASTRMKVGIITSGNNEDVFEHSSYKDRVRGFENEINQRYPQIEIVGQYFLGLDIFDYYDTIRNLMNEHPDLNGIYLVNPGDYSVCEIIKKVIGKKKIKLITNDVTKEIMDYLKSGIVSATISQDPESQGSLPLQILFNYLVLGKEPKKEVYYTKLDIFIPQSIS